MISEAQTSAVNFYNREYRIRRTGEESVQIRSFFWSVFLLFVLNTGKIRTRKIPYLGTFHAEQEGRIKVTAKI